MNTKRTFALAVTFLLGTVVGAAAARKMAIDPVLYLGKDKKEAGTALLREARELAASEGSWEKISVGRAYYLGGMKAEGQAIFDEVTGNQKAEGGDWIRVGRVYYEAGDWDKAKAAFEKAMALEPNDAPWMAEIGAYYNVKGERARAEELFGKSFELEPGEVWSTTKAAGSYLGVAPD
jgi:tetratricopeptide (TPR) repeat protein